MPNKNVKLSNFPLNQIAHADALSFLRSLPDESIHCCVTSPPYFGLRKYTDGDPNEIGAEATPAEFVEALVEVFREVRRVLRSDGTCWINLGDSYANDEKWGGSTGGKHAVDLHGNTGVGREKKSTGMPPKSRMMIPARVAIALQDDGWILRDEIVWHKPAPMPEPVEDRTVKSHEMIYMLVKRPRYFYNADAIREEFADDRNGASNAKSSKFAAKGAKRNDGGVTSAPSTTGRNKRSVWTVNFERSNLAHYAMFPTKLIEPMILAGCPKTVCAICGAPHYPLLEKTNQLNMDRPQARRAQELFSEKGLTAEHLEAIRAVGLADVGKSKITMDGAGKNADDVQRLADEAKAALGGYYREFTFTKRVVVGYQPSCTCGGETTAGIVLDPFMGSGTSAEVARWLGRNYTGCDLNEQNVNICRERLRMPFEQPAQLPEVDVSDLPLFKGVL